MARRVYAGRYAQAVFAIALERNELDRWQSDLRNIASLVADEAVVTWLTSPRVSFDDKTKLLTGRPGDINPLALNLIYLLATRGRADIIGNIADEYQRLLDSYHNVARAEVTTAVPLDNKDKSRLAEFLGAAVGKKVVIKSEVDSGLIGGLIARIGDKLLDGSTRSRLQALRNELAGAGR